MLTVLVIYQTKTNLQIKVIKCHKVKVVMLLILLEIVKVQELKSNQNKIIKLFKN